jgi:hypothetical protein
MTKDRFLDALLARTVSHAEIRNVNTSFLHAFEIKKDKIPFLLGIFWSGLVFLNEAFVFQVHDLVTNVTSFLPSTNVKLGITGTYALSTSGAQSQKLTSTFLL